MVVAQLVRAPDCGSGGRRFETDLPPSLTKKGFFGVPFFVRFIQRFHLYTRNLGVKLSEIIFLTNLYTVIL